MLGIPVHVVAVVLSFVINVEASDIRPSRHLKIQSDRQQASFMQQLVAEEPAPPVVHHYKTPAPTVKGQKSASDESLEVAAPVKSRKKAEAAPDMSPTGRHSSPFTYFLLFLICVIFCICACGFFFYLKPSRTGMRQSISVSERTPITALREGEWAKIVGEVVAVKEFDKDGPQVLRSPLQGMTCVHFNVTAVADGQQIARLHDCCNFYVQDETGGLVLIHATDVCAYHFKNVLQENYSAEVLPETFRRWLQHSRVQPPGDQLVEQAYDFEESVLQVGARVVALGVCIRLPRSGQLSLQSDTAVRKALAQEQIDTGLRKSLQRSLEREDWQTMASHVLVSDDPMLF